MKERNRKIGGCCIDDEEATLLRTQTDIIENALREQFRILTEHRNGEIAYSAYDIEWWMNESFYQLLDEEFLGPDEDLNDEFDEIRKRHKRFLIREFENK